MLRPSVETLFERFRSGDVAALGAVFDRTATELLTLACHLSRDQASAEDLVQGTFLAAIESAGSWDARQPLVPWLVGILANLARMERRREARRVAPERLTQGSVEDPAVTCETRELGESLERTVRALPEPYRAVLVLHLLHGLAAHEIADALGSPAGTVRSQITRGLELLRRALPVGLTATAVAVVTSPAALAAMRATVLEKAAAVCSAAAGGVASMSTLVLGGLAMKTKNVVLALGALVLAGTGVWLGLSAGRVASPLPSSPAGDVTVAPRPDAAAVAGQAPAPAVTATQEAVRAPATAAATGSLRVRVRWHDGTSAAGVVVSFEPKDIEGARLWRRWRTADASGVVEFTALPQSAAEVAALNGGDKVGVTIKAGVTSEAVLDVPRGIDVKGRVVDAGSRQPIAGASVGLVAWPDVREVTRTDEQGRFALRSVDWIALSKRPGFYSRRSVQVWAEGYETSLSWLLDRQATDPGREIEIPLRRGGGTIAGTVRDEAGRPVADALVLCGESHFSLGADAPDEEPVTGPSAPLQTSTDAGGKFALHGVPSANEEQVWVVAAAFACSCARVRARADRPVHVDITLQRGVTLRGTVRGPDGRPFARAHVEVLDRLSAPELIEDQRPDVVATSLMTLVDGRFAFPFLAAGRIEVRVAMRRRSDRPLAAYRAFDAEPGATLLWEAVLEERRIQGRVVDDLGQPIVGAGVNAGSRSRVPGVVSAQTDGNGLFRLAHCVDVPYSVECFIDGARVIEQSGVVPGSGLLTLVVPRSRLPSAKVTGVVRDANGAEIAGIQVHVLDDTGRGQNFVEVGPGGKFESRLLLPGCYRVEASHAERGTLALGRHEVKAGQVLDLGTVTFVKPGLLELTVVDARGEPWSGRLIVSRASDAYCHWLEVSGGKVRVGALAPGSYAFSDNSMPPLCFAVPPVEIRSGETTLVRIDECAGAWRKLRFPMTGRVPLAVWTTIRDSAGQVRRTSNFHFWQDADSDHDVLLPLGSYVLEARTADGRSATTPFEVTAAEAPPVAVKLP